MRAPVLLFVVGLACSSKDAAKPAGSELAAADTAAGRAIVGKLKKSLLGALTRALADGVPQAIDACKVEAPRIATAESVGGAVVGRATRKPRNPANLASGWQADALAYFEGLRAADKPLDGTWFGRSLPGDRVAYAEPLVIQPLCLTCHGATLAPEVTSALAERYPNDRATGYVDGDLRGIAWVEMPAAR